MATGKLDADEVAEIRALAASGVAQAEIARRLGVNRSTVSRVVSGARHAPLPAVEAGPVSAAVAGFLAGLDLVGSDRVRATTARALAGQLDACTAAGTAAAAAAAPRLVERLLAVVEAIEGRDDPGVDVAKLLAEVGNGRRAG